MSKIEESNKAVALTITPEESLKLKKMLQTKYDKENPAPKFPAPINPDELTEEETKNMEIVTQWRNVKNEYIKKVHAEMVR